MFGKQIHISEYPALYAFCDSMRVALLRLSKTFHILDANPIAEQLYATPKASMDSIYLPDFCLRLGLSCPVRPSTLAGINLPDQSPTIQTVHSLSGPGAEPCQTDWRLAEIKDDEGQRTGWLLTGRLFQVPVSKHKRYQDLQRILSSVPGAIYWKGLDGRYLGGNQHLLQLAGAQCKSDIINLRDDDMPWSQAATDLQTIDQQVVEKDATLTVEEYPVLADGQRAVMLSTKSPLKDDRGKIVGVIGNSVDVTHLKREQLNDEMGIRTPYPIKTGKASQQRLTPKEVVCVNSLIRGNSVPEIAESLTVTERTVRAHINRIKEKLNCQRQFQLGYVLGKYGNLLL